MTQASLNRESHTTQDNDAVDSGILAMIEVWNHLAKDDVKVTRQRTCDRPATRRLGE